MTWPTKTCITCIYICISPPKTGTYHSSGVNGFLNVHSTLRFHDSKPHKSNNRNRQSTTDNLDLGESCMFDEVSRYVHVNADQNLWHVQQLVTCNYILHHSTSTTLSLSIIYIYIKLCITFERLKSTRHEACFFVLSDMTSQSQWVSQRLRQGTFRAKPWVELHPMRHMSHGLRHDAGADGPAGVSRLSGRTVSKRRLRSRQEHGGPTSS